MNCNIEIQYKNILASYLNTTPDNIYLYYKGRVALYALLKAMNVGPGDEVIIPAFTCVVVPNAIKYVGATPIYVDINTHTYNADPDGIKKAINEHTKVIICQNTFGLSSDVEKIQALAAEHHLYSIEDCTHGFGGQYHQQPNGSYCDAAFYSTQWNKPFSTGVGGFAMVNNADIAHRLQAVNADLEPASVTNRISLSTLYFVREKILTEKRYWHMINLYRWLSKHQLVQGSSSGTEICSVIQPSHYFKAMSTTQMKKGLQNIHALPHSIALRKHNATIYNQYLIAHNKTYVLPELFQDHSFLKFPILVQHREQVLAMAEKEHLPLGEWFCSPIHPIYNQWELWDLYADTCPNAVRISSQILNLPTDIEDTNKIIRFLEKIDSFLI